MYLWAKRQISKKLQKTHKRGLPEYIKCVPNAGEKITHTKDAFAGMHQMRLFGYTHIEGEN